MFGFDNMPGVENSDEPQVFTKIKCIKIVAKMIKDGVIDEDPNMLNVTGKSDYDRRERTECDLNYYEQMARAYLDYCYNKVSEYTPSETLMYLAGKYSLLNNMHLLEPKKPKKKVVK